MASRFAGIKTNARSGNMELNKTAKALSNIAGIDVYSDRSKGEVKDMMQILQELNGVWDTLSQDKQLAIGEAVAGLEHANTFQALMGNWDAVLQYQEDYKNGWTVGSAERENQRYLDSAEGKINVLKENLKSLVTTSISSDMFKGVLDGAIAFTGALNNILSAFDSVGMAVPLVAGTLTSLFTSIKSIGTQTAMPNFFKNTFASFNKDSRVAQREAGKFGSTLSVAGQDVAKYNAHSNKLMSTYKKLPKTLQASTQGTKKYTASLNQTSKAGKEVAENGIRITTAFGKQAKSSALATAKNVAMGAGLSMLNGLFIGLATAGITLVVKTIYDYVNASQISAEQHRNNIEGIKGEISAYKSQKASLESIAGRYNELSKKTKKSAEELEEFNNIKNEIAEVMPELVVGYDSSGSPILAMKGDVNNLVGELERAIEKKQRLLESEQNGLGIDATDNIKKTKKALESSAELLSNSLMGGNFSINKALNNKEFFGLGDIKNIKDRAKEIDNAMVEQEKNYTKRYNEHLQNLKAYNADEQEIQTRNLNELFKKDAYTSLNDLQKGGINSFGSLFDWGDYDLGGQKKAVSGIEALSKAITDSEYDIDDFNKRWQEANDTFQNTGNVEDYSKSIEGLAKELEDVTGVSADTWVKGLSQQFEGLDFADAKLNKFLESYDSSLDKLSKGDSFATNLRKQFDDLENFNSTLRSGIQATGEVDVELLTNVKNGKDFQNLPDQVKTAIDGVLEKGGVTEAEQDLLLAITTSIENEGAISDEVSEQLNRLFKGELSEQELALGLKIGDFEIPPELAKILNDEYKKNPVEVDFKMNAEQAQAEMKAFDEKLSGMKDSEIAIKIAQMGIIDTVKELDMLEETLGQVDGKESKMEFVAECSQFFNGAESVQDAINAMPPELILKYGLKVDGEKGNQVEKLKKNLESLPKSVQTKMEVIGFEKLDLIQKLYTEYPDSKDIITSFIVNNEEGLSQVKSWDELIKLIPDETKKKIGMEVTGEETAGAKTKEVKENLDEIDNTSASAEVEVNESGVQEAKEEVEELKENIQSAKGEEIEVSANSGQVLDSIKDIETLIKYSAQMEDGKYKLDIEANTEQAVDSLRDLEVALGQVSNRMTNTPATTLKIETAQSAQNLSGLMTRIEQTQSALSGLSSKNVNINTAQSAQNLSGLIVRVQQYSSAINGVLSKNINVNTALSAQNISGLIRKIGEYNGTSVKNISIKSNASAVASQIRSITTALRNMPSSKNVTINVKQNGSVQSIANKVNSISSPPGVGEPAPSFEQQVSTLNSQIQSETLGMHIGARTGIQPLNVNSRATASTPIDMSTKAILDSVKYNIELLKELQNRIDSVGNSLSLLDKQMERAVGEDKIKYLKKQNELYKEQQKLQKDLESKMKQQQSTIKNALTSKGFKFNAEGNLTNYEEKLLAMEREAERLEEASKDASKKSSDYEGSDDKKKKSLQQASEKASKDAEDYKKSYEEQKKLVDEYLDLMNNGIPGAQEEWQELNNKIKENNDLMEQLDREQRLFKHINKVEELKNNYDALSDTLDLIGAKMEHATGSAKLKLMQEQIYLLEQQKKAQDDLVKSYKVMMGEYQKDLSNYGFKFDENTGNVLNMDEILNKYQGSEDLEKVKDLLQDYLKIQRDDLPDATKEWQELDNAIKDVHKEQLETAKDVENRITDMYKKQVEERKKLIDEELDKRLSALDKQKDAYNKAREEENYEKDYSKQQSVIDDLEKQIANLEKDTSASGKKKLQELMKQLEEEQEKLNDMVQDKIDKDFNDAIDSEKEKLEESAKEEEKKLDDKYSDEKLQELAKEALETGQFTDINGNIIKLEEAMLDYINKYEGGNGADGEYIRDEMMTDLLIAMKVMQDNIGKDFVGSIEKPLDKDKPSKNPTFEKDLEDLTGKLEKKTDVTGKKELEKIVDKLSEQQKNLSDVVENSFNELPKTSIGEEWKSGKLESSLGITDDALSELSKKLSQLNVSALDGVSKDLKENLSKAGVTASSTNISSVVNFNSPLIHVSGNVDGNIANELKQIGAQLKNEIAQEILSSMRS